MKRQHGGESYIYVSCVCGCTRPKSGGTGAEMVGITPSSERLRRLIFAPDKAISCLVQMVPGYSGISLATGHWIGQSSSRVASFVQRRQFCKLSFGWQEPSIEKVG